MIMSTLYIKRKVVSLLLITVMTVTLVGLTGSLVHAEEVDFLSDDFYEEDIVVTDINDPIEPFNRAMFAFNDTAYTWVLNPVASGYSYVLPFEFRDCIWNFFNNLEEPVRFVNCLLQGRFTEAGLAISRFFINSTCGVFGFADPASREFEIEPVYATLGETLSVWGVGDGFYLVVPFYGSSTLRDITGTVVDALALAPYYNWADNFETMIYIYSGKEINKLSLHLGEYEELKKISFDPYVALRNGYFQYRMKIRDHSEFKNNF